jgi:hypothetical protein
MLSDKLLEPFKELCELLPDLNNKRAKNKGQWIFTEEPLDWSEKFPRITIKISDFSILERPNQQSVNDVLYSFSASYNVNIIFYTKRMDEYECPDGVLRKGKLLLEFMSINVILPTILRNKFLLCKKYDWLETLNLTSVEKASDVGKYGLKQTFTLSATSTFNDSVPISNDSFINEITISDTIN